MKITCTSAAGRKSRLCRGFQHCLASRWTPTERKASQQHQTRRNYNSLNQDTPFQLCFLRHGQSTWNRDNRFIGWTDTPLTDLGVLEARVAGQMLYKSGMRFDEVHTSLLRRSIRTANLALMELGQEYIPVYKHWRLNERSYGDLVGKNKKQVVLEHGQDQVKIWRRSYSEPPPCMTDDHPFHPARDPRYRLVCQCRTIRRKMFVLSLPH
jgi:bisphosphoglycerate-dependent phosphoglycerate mutase family 1